MIRINRKAKTAYYLDEDVFYQGTIIGNRFRPDSDRGGFGFVEISDDIINTELFLDIETAFSVCGELPIIMGEMQLYDHNIVFLNNCGEDKSIICKDTNGLVHEIDLSSCATNFHVEHPTSSGKCVGERNAWLNYFIFYTSGIKIKLILKKKYVFGFNGGRCLKGNRHSRFSQLHNYIKNCGYTTYDIS